MAYTPASRTAGLSPPSCPAAVANRSFRVRVRCSASVLSSCLPCSSNAVPGILAGCAAAEVLRGQRADQGEDTDAGCDGRCGDFRVHERNLLRVATAATQKIAFGRIHGRGNRSAKSCSSRVVSRRTGFWGDTWVLAAKTVLPPPPARLWSPLIPDAVGCGRWRWP